MPHREKTRSRIQNTSQNPKTLLRRKNTSQNPKTRLRIQNTSQNSKTLPKIQKWFGFWKVSTVLMALEVGEFSPVSLSPVRDRRGGECTYKEEYPWLKYSSYFHSFEHLCTTEYPPTFSEHTSRRICVYCEGRGYESPLVQTV